MTDNLCDFKNCDGLCVIESCGCKICKKCKKVDGTKCNYL